MKGLIVADTFRWRRHIRDLLENEFADLTGTTVVASKEGEQCEDDQTRQLDFSNLFIRENERLVDFDYVLSVHCRQIFNADVVRNVPCYNLHPGILPHGRGMYPYVFDMAYGRECGATLHRMTDVIDRGSVVARRVVDVHAWDTVEQVYERIWEAECELLHNFLSGIRKGDTPLPYDRCPEFGLEGLELPPHTKRDYYGFCELCPAEIAAVRKIAALTWKGQPANAYFVTPEGDRVRVSVNLEKIDE